MMEQPTMEVPSSSSYSKAAMRINPPRKKRHLHVLSTTRILAILLLVGPGLLLREQRSAHAFAPPHRLSRRRPDSFHCRLRRNNVAFKHAGLDMQAGLDHFNQDDDLSSLSQRLGSLSDGYFRNRTVQEVQHQLVRLGAEWNQTFKDDQDVEEEYGIRTSRSQRVPGCMATVTLQVRLKETTAPEGSSFVRIDRVDGTADALVSRGLVATVAKLTQGVPVSDVLALPAANVAERLGLSHALSVGRNNGLASLWTTLQELIHQVVVSNDDNNDDDDDENSVSKVSAVATKDHNNMDKVKPRVALLLSGGVDSAVSLHLLLQQGYDVTAFYLKIWLEDELAHLGECPWEQDMQMCETVCRHAGHVPLETISLQEEYKERVLQYTVREAEMGRTPNPDIMCNSRVKFGVFYDAIVHRDFDHVATGHYARLVQDGDSRRMRLFRAPDPVKDQSYFLCALTQSQLQRVLFPIGHLQKTQVRELADQFQLPNRNRPDSQGLCFLGKVKFDAFLAAYLGQRPGPIVNAATGQVLGQHDGLWYHTVGQRKGLGKCLTPTATSQGPWYVVAKDVQGNTVYCSNEYDSSQFEAARCRFVVEHVHWIANQAPRIAATDTDEDATSTIFDCTLKIRHGPKLAQAQVRLLQDDTAEVRLEHKDGGLAPGQYVAFYDGEECLGGAVISEHHWATFLLEQQREQVLANRTSTV